VLYSLFTQKAFLLFFPLLLFVSCQRSIPLEGRWEGSLELTDRVQLPFELYLDLQTSDPSGYFLVGDERTPVPEIFHRGDSLIFLFSEYGGLMRGRWNGSTWSGVYLRFRADTTSMPFSASPTAFSRVTRGKEDLRAVPPIGKHRVFFQRQDRVDSSTIASFWMKEGKLQGTFIAPDGDYGLLVAEAITPTLQLNRFTGWQAIAITMKQEFGEWSGTYRLFKNPPQAFILKPLETTATKSIAERVTRMINPNEPFTFAGISVDGDSVKSTDDRFKGKALLIDIMGTWCHNCMDAAPLLQQIYQEYKDDGLEVVGLSFEIHDDVELGKKNLRLYRDRFNISFPLLFAGTTEASNVEAKLRSQLADFFAYPTSIFIGKDGKVRSIHVGFKGPGAGEEYQHQVQEFYEMVRQLLGKKQPA
jgi:thiol-disulfide isomerase/thioredoxin